MLKKAKVSASIVTYGGYDEAVQAARSLRFSRNRKMVYNPSAQDVWISVDREPVRIAGGEFRKL